MTPFIYCTVQCAPWSCISLQELLYCGLTMQSCIERKVGSCIQSAGTTWIPCGTDVICWKITWIVASAMNTAALSYDVIWMQILAGMSHRSGISCKCSVSFTVQCSLKLWYTNFPDVQLAIGTGFIDNLTSVPTARLFPVVTEKQNLIGCFSTPKNILLSAIEVFTTNG